jgi:hypothetical protein
VHAYLFPLHSLWYFSLSKSLFLNTIGAAAGLSWKTA